MIWHQPEPVALRDRWRDKLCLHHRKVTADAQVRPAAEGKVGVVRAGCNLFRAETLRVEHLRLLPEIGMAMGDVRAEPDQLFPFS